MLQCSPCRPFHALPSPAMELFLTPDRGWGVAAGAPIPRGTFIVEYAGEVVEEPECRARMAAAKAAGQPHFYMMELAPGLIIDACHKCAGLARPLSRAVSGFRVLRVFERWTSRPGSSLVPATSAGACMLCSEE